MAQILILADDMTGANDTGASIRSLGYRVFSVNDVQKPLDWMAPCDCISVNLDSRSLLPSDAYDRVTQAASRFSGRDTQLFSKRIDSTLRGNLGTECDALQDFVPGDPACLVVPAFPQAGRTYHGGALYIYDAILTATSAASDPKCPIRTASPKERFQEQSRRKITTVPIQQVRTEIPRLAELIRMLYSNGLRTILFEAETQKDISSIARAAVDSQIPFICADPGPFTAAVVRERFSPQPPSLQRNNRPRGCRVLAVVGSVNPISCQQTLRLMERPDTGTVILNAADLLTGAVDSAVVETVRRVMSQPRSAATVLLVLSSTLEKPEQRLDFAAEARARGTTAEAISRRVNEALALAAASCIRQGAGFGGLFSCGGDISSALFQAMGINCMEVLEEIIPLAVCSRLKTGHLIVTKGGMVGGSDDIYQCIEYMRRNYLTFLN